MSKRRNHDAGFKACVALETVKGERAVSELAAAYGVHPTMIHQWTTALLEGASDIFERGRKKKAEIDEETVRSLHAKIGLNSAAQLLLTAGDNPERLKSEASFTALRGVSPVPASNRDTSKTSSSKRRANTR